MAPAGLISNRADAHALHRSVHRQIFSLPDACLLYPGHDYRGLTVTSVGEEKEFNPRLGGALSEDDFAGYMENLKLAHPKQIAVAVPANLKCGVPDTPVQAGEPDWAPLSYTFAGVWEVQPSWLDEHRYNVQILDVREPERIQRGRCGRIPGAILIPLGQLSGALRRNSPKSKPIVLAVCRAGGRSAQATNMLRQAGFEQVANLSGGMLRWRTEGCAVPKAARVSDCALSPRRRPRLPQARAAFPPESVHGRHVYLLDTPWRSSFRQSLREIDVIGRCNRADFFRYRFVEVHGMLQSIVDRRSCG